jgi:hypothetical protein
LRASYDFENRSNEHRKANGSCDESGILEEGLMSALRLNCTMPEPEDMLDELDEGALLQMAARDCGAGLCCAGPACRFN